MADFILSRKALQDLEDIWLYTCQTWSEEQADAYYHLMTDAFQNIARLLVCGKSYDEIFHGLSGLRVGQHIIFYKQGAKQRVEIIRILHVRMDLRSKFK